MKKLTIAAVNDAVRRYDSGERPFRFTPPRSWYLVGVRGRVYPLKYIYGLAIGSTPSAFNTSDPIRELQRLGFELRRQPKDLNADFEKQVKGSLLDPKGRALRLAKAPRLPKIVIREVQTYERNPDVVAEVLARANGFCGLCGSAAPFHKRGDGKPYLEVHHVVQLAHGGDDAVDNAVAACQNCHRKAHFG